MNKICDDVVQSIAKKFDYNGVISEIGALGNGHINGTYLVKCIDGEKVNKYSLQKVNSYIFKDVDSLMNNIFQVTSFIRNKLDSSGKDGSRGTLNFVKTVDGNNYYLDDNGDCWRSYNFVDDVVALEKCRNTDDFYRCGEAFGDFQFVLSDFPAEKLVETIKDFHNTPKRFKNLVQAYENDVVGRAKNVVNEYQFAVDRIDDYGVNIELLNKGLIPLRVTHNDTKLNNILFDKQSGMPVCIIDLDTVMPGLSVNDFGDSIRFGASTAAEDETDLDKVEIDLDLYKAYVKGYIKGCKGCLTRDEILALPMGAKLMTIECGMRFLTDYLENDVYFKTDYPEHNLVRARTQFKLVADMEEKWDQMIEIIKIEGEIY